MKNTAFLFFLSSSFSGSVSKGSNRSRFLGGEDNSTWRFCGTNQVHTTIVSQLWLFPLKSNDRTCDHSLGNAPSPVVIKNPMALLVKSRGVSNSGVMAKFPPLALCQSWPPNNPHPVY